MRGGKQNAAIGPVVFIILTSLYVNAWADNISLPLKGYFHPGRAMPVQWDISSANSGGTIQLSATGAISSRVQSAGYPHGIFPWLVVDRNVRDIRWHLLGDSGQDFASLHPLEDSDCLAASTLDNDSAAGALFPGRRLVLLHLTNGVEGPPTAWETLDALLLTPDALAKTSISARADLFAAGVELAAIQPTRPDAILPWRRDGQWWIASSNLPGPASVDSDAYAPTFGWTAGRSADFRRHIFLLGTIYCLVIAGLALWRSRWMPAAIVAASILAGSFFASDNRKYSPVFRRHGIVRLIDEAAIDDHWVFQISHRDAEFRMPVEGFSHPIFFDSSEPQTMNLTLDCGDHGQPVAISGRLSADEPLALMRRQASLEISREMPVVPVSSPLRLLAADPIYRGFTLVGQLNDPIPDESWPTVVLKPADADATQP
jgi:hypothetical protein